MLLIAENGSRKELGTLQEHVKVPHDHCAVRGVVRVREAPGRVEGLLDLIEPPLRLKVDRKVESEDRLSRTLFLRVVRATRSEDAVAPVVPSEHPVKSRAPIGSSENNLICVKDTRLLCVVYSDAPGEEDRTGEGGEGLYADGAADTSDRRTFYVCAGDRLVLAEEVSGPGHGGRVPEEGKSDISGPKESPAGCGASGSGASRVGHRYLSKRKS